MKPNPINKLVGYRTKGAETVDMWLKNARTIIAEMRADSKADECPDGREWWSAWCDHMEGLTDDALLQWRRSENAESDLFRSESTMESRYLSMPSDEPDVGPEAGRDYGNA